ncbi:MAG: hypothetical protein ACI4VE_05720 [Clostridia bacterium]
MKLSYLLKNQSKFKNKIIYIGMLGLNIEDIIKYKHCFNKNDIFRLESQV